MFSWVRNRIGTSTPPSTEKYSSHFKASIVEDFKWSSERLKCLIVICSSKNNCGETSASVCKEAVTFFRALCWTGTSPFTAQGFTEISWPLSSLAANSHLEFFTLNCLKCNQPPDSGLESWTSYLCNWKGLCSAPEVTAKAEHQVRTNFYESSLLCFC